MRPGEVVLPLDPRLWWKFGELAELRGVPIEDLLLEAAADYLDPALAGASTRQALIVLNARGFSDSRIGELVGVTNGRISRLRAELDLPVRQNEVRVARAS